MVVRMTTTSSTTMSWQQPRPYCWVVCVCAVYGFIIPFWLEKMECANNGTIAAYLWAHNIMRFKMRCCEEEYARRQSEHHPCVNEYHLIMYFLVISVWGFVKTPTVHWYHFHLLLLVSSLLVYYYVLLLLLLLHLTNPPVSLSLSQRGSKFGVN